MNTRLMDKAVYIYVVAFAPSRKKYACLYFEFFWIYSNDKNRDTYIILFNIVYLLSKFFNYNFMQSTQI